MKNYLKRTTTFVLALLMLLSVPLQAFAESTQGADPPKEEKKINYDITPIHKGDYVNKVNNLPVVPAKPGEGVKSEDYIKDPAKPKLYTVKSDFKVLRGQDEIVSYQPYVATVGDDKYTYKDIDGSEKGVLSDAEKEKINKTLVLPVLDGYTSPTPTKNLDVKYSFINDPNKRHEQDGDEVIAKHDFIYKPKEAEIHVKHLFQDFGDLEKFGRLPGATEDKITTQTGQTGTSISVQPLPVGDRKGYVPESTNITTKIPENTKDFIVEYRYKRAYFDVVYDTKGKHYKENKLENKLEDEAEYGTSIPTRRAFYEQRIPKLIETEIPTKIGCDFLGWMPSVEIKGTINDNKTTFNKGEVIKDSNGNAILDLYNTIRAKESNGNLKVDPTTKKPVYTQSTDNIEIIMPSEKLTFIALWAPKPKADYAIQFWTEKADHADDASLEEKYEFIGARVYKDQDTGSRPNLNNVSVKDIVFPDLDQKRLAKIWKGVKFNRGQDLYLNRFYVYNQALTKEQNKDPENATLVKSVDATGKTVYNIYYDRQVYDLYFTKSNALPAENTFYPEIWGYDEAQGEVVKKGGPGNPYHYKARFNQLMLGWPNDAMQTKGFSEGMQSFGWGPNYNNPIWPTHLDTPPYRLNADEFLDMKIYDAKGGYTKKIDKGDGTNIDLKWDDYTTLSFGIKQAEKSMPHHMDFWMDGFKGDETIIRYDLYRYKADTNSETYAPKYPKVQGFTGKSDNETPEYLDSDGIDAKNEERAAVTPFPTKTYTDMYGARPVGKMEFIKAFFNNGDEWGDPDGWDGFKTNGYLKFEYSRNKYPLRFNYDPSVIKGDNEFNDKNSLETFYEFPLLSLNPDVDGKEQYKIVDEEVKKGNESNLKSLIDNPNNLQKLNLTDLVDTDPKDGKVKVKRPDNITDQMVFKGWALDPAGTKMIWENPGEKMPTHPVNLYAKWDEPDYQWKVTFDANGGKLDPLDIDKLTDSKKKVRVGDVGQEEEKTFPIKGYKNEKCIQGDKQVFTVIHRQKLRDLINKVDPSKSMIPNKKGYEFMGWEVLRYKKDEIGDYTDELDLESSKAYREKYKIPEIYAFGNDVVAPIYLKAIWIKNDTIDIPVYHHFLDAKYNETQEPKVQWLRGKRVGSYLAAGATKQNQDRILIPKEEWGKLEKGTFINSPVEGAMSYKDFKKLNDDPDHPRVNSYFQQIRIEPPKIKDEEETAKQGKDVYKDNPKAKNNEFHFYYRPFRKREYKVNYIDERFQDKTDEKAGAIIDQETVINDKRHFDARNFRTIPGWKLVSAPQQQLIFDINEDTNEFKGINGTGKDEITFYYKDVRIVETKSKKDPLPDGYVRITFKADKGGSFGKDAQGNEIKEIYYDVINGLKSDYLPVPQLLKEGETKDDKKYYITPDVGKSFKEWTDDKLLNDNTIIEHDYTFTAKFDWSGAAANPMVVTEAFKDENADATKDWSNKFAPTIEQLKKQIVWKEKDVEKKLPDGTEIKLYDEAGNELTTNEQVYDLVNEKKAADKDETFRVVNIKAKVTFKDGKEPQELTIPITVYKNVYEALTGTDKPKYLSDAEKGELKDITGNYVKVTVNPTGKPGEKDSKIYYVNKNAWVEIPEIKLTDVEKKELGFTNWTADKKAQNEKQEENGIYDFNKRHKFTEDTVISPGFSKDVVPQEGEEKPKVPDNFVKVIVKTTDKATDDTKFEKTFWVNPTKEVAIPVTEPKGKTDQEIDIPKLGKKKVNYIFKEWQKVKTGESDDSLADTNPVVKIDLAKNKYTDKVTVIEAAYYERFAATPIVKPIKTEELHTPEGKEITDKDLIGKITPPANKEIESITVVEKPDPSKPGKQEAKVTIKYKDGTTQGTDKDPVVIPVEVHKNIIPAGPNGEKPEKALENYVKVIFKAGTGGTVSGNLVYYVSPEVEVDLTEVAGKIEKKPNVGYISGNWDTSETKKLKAKFTAKETEFTFNFTETKDIVEKIDEKTKKPDGYVTVRFLTNKNGTLTGTTTYYVNPEAKKKMTDINAPTITANDGYKVGSPKWKPDLAADTADITEDKIFVANYDSLGKAEINYISMDTNMGTVSSPSESIFENQNIVGSTATAKDGYKFVKWTDVTGKQVSTDAKFVPDKKESATYIAIFEKEETIADKLKSYDLAGLDLGVFVGDTLTNDFWKDGVSKQLKKSSNLTENEKKELEKALKDATVSDKSGRNSKHEVLSPSIGILEIRFNDGSTLTVEQKLYVYDNGSQVPKDPNQPTPTDKVEVTYVAGEGVEKFDEKTVMVKKGTSKKDLPGRPKAKAKEGYKDLKWTADPAIDETNGIQEKTTLTASAVTDHDFAKTSFTVKKVWSDNVNDVPTMNFTLYRKVEGGQDEPVKVDGAEVKTITKENVTATWDKLAKTDSTGKEYTYFVKETFKDENSDVRNANWILGKMETENGTNTITNKLKTVPADGITPNENEHRMGKITITKKIESKVIKPQMQMRTPKAPAALLEFTFKVTDPYGNVVKVDGQDTFTLKAGESKELNNLLYGEYNVEETDAKGLTPFVKVGNGDETESKTGKVTLTTTAKDGTVTFTNKNVKPQPKPNIIEVKASKVWVNGPSTDHTAIDLKLYRQVDSGQKEEVKGVTLDKSRDANDVNKFNYVWKDLSKINDEGKEYNYSVEEAGVTNNEVKVGENTYTVSQEGNTITNTYVVPKTEDNVIGKKVWSGVPDEITPPTVKLELWRKTSAYNPGEKVVDARALDENNQADFGKQDKADANGVKYIYFVKEVDENERPFRNDRYDSEVNNLTVTNTYKPPTKEYKVTYLPGSQNATGSMDSVKVAENTNYTVLANGFTNPGYTFKGWKLDNGPKIIEAGSTIKVKADVKLTAQWEKITTPPRPGDQDNPDKPNPGYPGGPGYPSYPDRPYIPMYPEVRYETIIKEKIVKVPVPVPDGYFKEVRYMQGFNGYFRPNDGLTRAEAAQILANALVEDGYKYNPNFKISYKDVGEAWYTRAVKIVTEAKVFTGYDDGNFKPQAKITRNEWIATLKRFQELGDASGNNMKLRDGHWAKAEIQAAFNEGWLKIYTDGLATYKGDEFIPRQEVAAVSNKAFKRIVDKTYIGKNNLSLVTYKDVNTSMWAYEDILCASNTFLDRKDRYIAHWVKEDKNQFNIDTSDFKIVQKNFQRNPR